MCEIRTLKISCQELKDMYFQSLQPLHDAAKKNDNIEAFEHEVVKYISAKKYCGRQAHIAKALLRMIEYNGTRISDMYNSSLCKINTFTDLWRFLRSGDDIHMDIDKFEKQKDMLIDIYHLFKMLSINYNDSDNDDIYTYFNLKGDMKRWDKASDNAVIKLMRKSKDKMITALSRLPDDRFTGEYKNMRKMNIEQRKEAMRSLWDSYSFQLDFSVRSDFDLRLLLSGGTYRKLIDVANLIGSQKSFITPYYLSLFNTSLNGYDDVTLREAVNFIERQNNDIFLQDNQSVKEYIEDVVKSSKADVEINIHTSLLSAVPQRFDSSLMSILEEIRRKYGSKESRFTIITSIQSPLEVTPDVKKVIDGFHKAGWRVCNAAHFTIALSRRGCLSHLREVLNCEGVLSYHIFALRNDYPLGLFTPGCRCGQEIYEEKIFGKTDTVDEINILKQLSIGKNHRNIIKYYMTQLHLPFIDSDKYHVEMPKNGRVQNSLLIGITSDGSRVYRFEGRNSDEVKSGYFVEPISVRSYLSRLSDMGENLNEYKSIWGYI